ncbi:hypothetical protein ACHAXS_003802 [Conticribra weissflogii]
MMTTSTTRTTSTRTTMTRTTLSVVVLLGMMTATAAVAAAASNNIMILSKAILLPTMTNMAHAFSPATTTTSSSLSSSSWYMTALPRQRRPRDASIARSASENPEERSSSSTPTNSQSHEKRSGDRTIDRRKSPALWRYDLSSSVLPSSSSPSSSSRPDTVDIHHPEHDHDQPPQRPPELMSPAGGPPQLRAAIANGADAVYLGLTSYSARARADNFDPHDDDRDDPASLAGAVALAHRHRVRVYVALNTLAFDGELREIEKLLERCWECGVDAVIVQDVGVALIAGEVVRRKMTERRGRGGGKQGLGLGLEGAPMEIHASTQQTVTCADGVAFSAERTNATRVVLGRELSLAEITHISTNTPTEIEAFVHGALCVSYSGQCFSSEAWGGRSANRGQCAQACRLPYGLIANGELRYLALEGGMEGLFAGRRENALEGKETEGYLLSPQDLCGLDQVEGLVRAGVSCLKIEGRLKDASYVAATTRAYRMAIDGAWAKVLAERKSNHRENRNDDDGDDDDDDNDSNNNHNNNNINNNNNHTPQRILASPEETVSRSDLTHVFARGQDEHHDGLTPGFFEGPKHQRLVRGRSPRHRGVHIGRVVSAKDGNLIVKLDDKWYRRDGADGDSIAADGSAIPPPLKLGDGIVVDRSMPQEEELGGPVYNLKWNSREGLAKIGFGRDVQRRWIEHDALVLNGGRNGDGRRGGISSSPVVMAPKGAHVWKTADAEVGKRMKHLAELDPPKSVAKVFVKGRVGEPLTVKITDMTSGKSGCASSEDLGLLQSAEGKGLDIKSIRKAIGTLGNSRWTVLQDGIDVDALELGCWCPVSWIKETRRRALANLESVFEEPWTQDDHFDRYNGVTWTFDDEAGIVDRMLDEIARGSSESLESNKGEARVSVLARSFEQVDAICNVIEGRDRKKDSIIDMSLLNEIIVDFLEIDGINAAVSRIREAKSHSSSDLRVIVASPRIIKPGEEGIWRTLLKTRPDGILIRSTGLLYRLTQLGGAGEKITIHNSEDNETMEVTIPELIGDFSLNAANAITAYELLQSGLRRITASYDLSANAITELATLLGKRASQLEVVVHQHMPIFHTEHCVFARFLSNGNSYQDCGHVCTRNTVHLRDQNGQDNLVLADMGCRNTVFMAESQSGVYNLNDWRRAGVGRLRIELVDEDQKDSVEIVTAYLGFLSGERQAYEVWSVLDGVRDSNGRMGGVGVGSLRNTVERRSGEITPSYR